MSKQRPPALARWLLQIQPLGSRRAEIEADLHELYEARVGRQGIRYARRRYYRDVLSLWRARRREADRIPDALTQRGGTLTLVQDLTYAGRMCRRNPGVVVVAVAGLGIAIGVSTSIFSIVNGIALKPSGIDDPPSVLRIYRGSEGGYSSSWQYSEFEHFRHASPSVFVEGWLMEWPFFAPADAGQGQSISAMFVTGGFLPALTTRVTAGRLLAKTDDSPGAPPVAVVSHGYWIRQLGEDPGVVGRTMKWNGVDVTVVGITAQGFRGTNESAPDLWVPIAAFPRLMGASPRDIAASPMAVIGRLASGVTVRQAEAQLNAAVASLPPPAAIDRDRQPARGVHLDSADSSLPRSKRGAIAAAFAIVTGVVALLLVLGCVNVTSLLLANGIARRRELGVRVALGASRARVVRQLMTESLSLGLLGGLAGLIITVWLLPVLTRVAGAPASLDVSMDGNVMAFLIAVSVVAGLGAGVAPARHAARDDVSSVLKAGGPGGGSGRMDRIRATVMGVQAAASIVLVVLAALLTRGMVAATRVDVGFAADRLLAVRPAFPPGETGRVAARAFMDAAMERLAPIPGVVSYSLGTSPPYIGAARVTIFNRPDGRYTINHHDTDAGYFSTLGLRVVRGRTYTMEEVRDKARVAVVSEALARDFFPGEDPLGQPLSRVVEEGGDAFIIGVVSNTITSRLRERSEAAIYQPMSDRQSAAVLIRTESSPSLYVATIRRALQPSDTRLRLEVTPVSEGLARQLGESRTLASLASTLAAVALGLAIVGLHGVTAFVINQRSKEITLRVALGATPRDVLRMLLGDSLRPVMLGLSAGVFVALGAGRLIAGTLYGIGPADPIAFGGSIVVLLLSATAAIIVPARRAATVDPAEVLKQV
jgi:predicted permease